MNIMSFLIIREPTENDAESINELIKTTFMQFVAPDYSPEGIKFFLNLCNVEALKEKIKKGQIYIAVEDDQILGVIWTRDLNHISRYFVSPSDLPPIFIPV